MRRSQKGFTLVELLVVIGIIAMLAVMAGGNYLTSLRRGRNAARIADVKKIQDGFEQFYLIDNLYWDRITTTVDCSDMLGEQSIFPQNPLSNKTGYDCSNTVSTYCLCVELEEVTAGERPGANSGNANCGFTVVPSTHYCAVNLQ
jgi:prepilin-type N-terminal cleavage/methylation domain-containing protein